MEFSIVQADYQNPAHAEDLMALLTVYALDPMGGGKPLSKFVEKNLIAELAKFDGAVSVLAYHDAQAVGLINAFKGFSTFACKPLLNIHDVLVRPEYRGMGIAGEMLAFVQALARQQGFCKLTLEVLAENKAAQASYRKFGFSPYQLTVATGQALFWEKPLR